MTDQRAKIYIKDTEFTGNTAAKGGALYNDTEAVLVVENAEFTSNKAADGGVIYNNGGTLNVNNSTFKYNEATGSGGVINAKQATSQINITNSTFEHNSAVNAGALNSDSTSGKVTISGSTFNENVAADGTGAAGLFKESVITDTTFTGNVSKATEYTDGAGAIFLGSGAQTTITGTKNADGSYTARFADNTSGAQSGALGTRDMYTELNGGVHDNQGAKLTIKNVEFTNNAAGYTLDESGSRQATTGTSVRADGGAINNQFYHSAEAGKEDYVYVEGSKFADNKALRNGGAIYNAGKTDTLNSSGVSKTDQRAKIYIKDTEFTGNTAAKGGALYNDEGATTVLEGTTFSGNTANGKANDIYNAGTVEAKSGNTFAGGMENNGIFNVTGAGNLSNNVTGTGTVNIQNGGDLTNIGEMTQALVSIAAGGELSTGVINGNLENSGTVNFTSGTLTDEKLAGYTGSGTFNLADAAIYDTTSGKVFTKALTTFTGDITSQTDKNAYADANNYGTNSLAANKLTYAGGEIDLNDTYYTLDYAKLAKSTLKDAGSNSNLVMKGTLINKVDMETGRQTVLVDALDNNEEAAKITPDEKTTVLTLNGDLLVGSGAVTQNDETVAAINEGTNLTIKDTTSRKEINAEKIELANTATGIIITNESAVTLGRAASAKTADEVVTVTDKAIPELDVDVQVGLDQATFEAVNETLAEGQKLAKKEGSFSVGSGAAADADKKHELAGRLTVNENSKATLSGQTTIAKAAIVKDGTDETGSRQVGTLEIKNGAAAVKDGVENSGNIVLDNAGLIADVAGNGTMSANGESFVGTAERNANVQLNKLEVKTAEGESEAQLTINGSVTAAAAELGTNSSVVVNGMLTSDNLKAYGTGNVLAANNTIAYGTGQNIYGRNSGGFGDPNYVYAEDSYVYGNNNTIGAAGSVSDYTNIHVVGNNNNITGSNTFVLGSSVTSNATNSVILGHRSTAPAGADSVVSVGAPGSERRIINLAAGVEDTDAVNVGQMKNYVAEHGGSDPAIRQELNAVSGEVREVGAIAAALAGLHYAEPSGEEGDKLVGAVAYGGYRGAGAEAVGIAYKPNPNMMFSASTSISNGNNSQNAYNAGFSLKFGKGETAKTRAELKKQVKFVNEENKLLKTQIVNLSAENAEQSSEIQTLKDDKTAQGKLIQLLLDRVEKLEKGGASKSAPVSEQKQPKPETNTAKPDTLQKVQKVQKPVTGKNIQVFSSARKSDSQRLADRLNAKGYNAFVGEGIVKGRTYYRTFVDGGDNPQAVLSQLKAAGINGFIFK